jgi:hypothetical protein
LKDVKFTMQRRAKHQARRGRSLALSQIASPLEVGSGVGLAAPLQVASKPKPAEWNCDWIPSLAEPYLRGYTPQFEKNSLLGYRFLAPGSVPLQWSKKGSPPAGSACPWAGFFVGYLLDASGLPFLKSTPPEFLVFCFVGPRGGRLHRRLVSEPESLMRRSAEYIRWLTHHPPRFELFAAEHTALVRHLPTQEWPAGRTDHYARNFTIETLAWLVRSALVRRLPGEIAASSHAISNRRAARK